ncbi:sialidase family protein [Paenibacillus hodogayensis]|uniref:Sialidase family protein n=1 Tax=Paenibacillus hodogayensis TaxID=279208 RepID=A0ABV5VQV4_9BACL
MPNNMGASRPLAQSYTVAAQLEKKAPDSYLFFISTGFAMLPSGHMVAGAPIFRRFYKGGYEGHGVALSISRDKGRTWHPIWHYPSVTPLEMALFVHENRLYMLITPHTKDGGRIWVTASDDEGLTWSEPVEVINGPFKWLASHQLAMTIRDGRLFWAVSEENMRLAVVSCDLGEGLLNPNAWRISNFTEMPIPPEINPGLFPGPDMRCLEGNVVSVNGHIRVIARAVIDRQGTASLAAVYDLNIEDGKLELTFSQFYPVPGAQCKVYIVYDEQSRLFWMASNIPANSQKWIDTAHLGNPGNDRRFLLLWYSCDALNWFPAGCIAAAEKLTQSFHYASMVIDGDDLAIISRTSLNSGNEHDSELLTFHRVREFRSLAMDIFPKV